MTLIVINRIVWY